MKEGPDIARVGALIGDPARANMLSAMMAGGALTAGELAQEAGVTPATAASHLHKLVEGGLAQLRRQGRHRYYALAGTDVADALERLMGVAARRGHLRSRPGPKDPALRRARVCYDHLAGDLAVALFDRLTADGRIAVGGDDAALTMTGREWATAFGIDLNPLDAARRPLCRACLDWGARRSHLGGGLGAAVLAETNARGWTRRVEGSRIVILSSVGETGFSALLAGEA